MDIRKNLQGHHRCSVAHDSAIPSLTINRLVKGIGVAMISLFLPIFLYEFFDFSIHWVLFWFLLVHLVKIPFYVPAAKLFSKIGLKMSMLFGTLALALFLVCFYLLSSGSSIDQNILLGSTIIILIVHTTLYWCPFHIDFATFSKRERRGRDVSFFYAFQMLIAVIAPLVGGLLIVRYGHNINFLVGLFFVVMSLIPLAYIPKTKVKYEFGFIETFKKMFDKRYCNMSYAMMANGAEELTSFSVWPIFLYVVFEGEYLEIGAFAAIIIVISFLLHLFVGKMTDKKSKRGLVHTATWIYSLGWLAKSVVDSVIGVFVASTFHSFGGILLNTPRDALIYEQAADAGHYIDEYTIIKEISLSIGRVLMMGLLIVITCYFSIPVAFVIAAIVSLGMGRLSKQPHFSKSS
ncbi:MAG: MFS transporter [Patescibacteria group bacterium]